jgi:hypothetical protein
VAAVACYGSWKVATAPSFVVSWHRPTIIDLAAPNVQKSYRGHFEAALLQVSHIVSPSAAKQCKSWRRFHTVEDIAPIEFSCGKTGSPGSLSVGSSRNQVSVQGH